jgi:uncharacterized protein YegL
MAGAPIEAVNQGVQLLFLELLNAQNQGTIYISAITFGTSVQVVRPLTELLAFEPPILRTRGASSLGAALRQMMVDLDQNFHPPTQQHPGDYRPLVFIMTDGEPSDEWEAALRQLQHHDFHPSNIVVILCGNRGKTDRFSANDLNVLNMNQITGEHLLSALRWDSLD